VIVANHVVAASAAESVILLAIPALWILGVALLIVRKLRTR
jgi:hypothetical protein